MPRFFFDFHNKDVLHPGEEGGELATPEMVRTEAVRSLTEYARDKLPDGETHPFGIEVRNEDGRVIYVARLLFQGTWTR